MNKAYTQGLISVVVINRNHGEYIAQTLESILRQDYKRVEVIIVDALSTDSSIQEISKYSQKLDIRVIREFDFGSSHGIIKGVNKVRGEFFVITTSTDGFLDQRWFSYAIKLLDRKKKLAGVQGRISIVNAKGETVNKFYQSRFQSTLSPGGFFCHWLFRGIPILETTCIWRTALVRDLLPPESDYQRNNDLLNKDCIYELKFNVMSNLKLIKPTSIVAGFVRTHGRRLSADREISRLTLVHQLDYIASIKELRRQVLRSSKKFFFNFQEEQQITFPGKILFFLEFVLSFPAAVALLIYSKLRNSIKNN